MAQYKMIADRWRWWGGIYPAVILLIKQRVKIKAMTTEITNKLNSV